MKDSENLVCTYTDILYTVCIYLTVEVILRQSFTCSACSVLIKMLSSEKTQSLKQVRLDHCTSKCSGAVPCADKGILTTYQAVVATISLAVLSKLFNNR